MTDEERIEIAHLRDEMAAHTAVDLKAHDAAAEARKEMMRMITEVRDSVSGLVDVSEALAGFVKVMKWVGKLSVWVAGIFGAIAAFMAIRNPPNG